MSLTRKSVFSRRIRDEAMDGRRLEQFIDAELRQHLGSQNEPDFIAVEFERTSPEGVDRYTDYVLGALLETYAQSGWKITASLTNDNKNIKLWFR